MSTTNICSIGQTLDTKSLAYFCDEELTNVTTICFSPSHEHDLTIRPPPMNPGHPAPAQATMRMFHFIVNGGPGGAPVVGDVDFMQVRHLLDYFCADQPTTQRLLDVAVGYAGVVDPSVTPMAAITCAVLTGRPEAGRIEAQCADDRSRIPRNIRVRAMVASGGGQRVCHLHTGAFPHLPAGVATYIAKHPSLVIAGSSAAYVARGLPLPRTSDVDVFVLEESKTSQEDVDGLLSLIVSSGVYLLTRMCDSVIVAVPSWASGLPSIQVIGSSATDESELIATFDLCHVQAAYRGNCVSWTYAAEHSWYTKRAIATGVQEVTSKRLAKAEAAGFKLTAAMATHLRAAPVDRDTVVHAGVAYYDRTMPFEMVAAYLKRGFGLTVLRPGDSTRLKPLAVELRSMYDVATTSHMDVQSFLSMLEVTGFTGTTHALRPLLYIRSLIRVRVDKATVVHCSGRPNHNIRLRVAKEDSKTLGLVKAMLQWAAHSPSTPPAIADDIATCTCLDILRCRPVEKMVVVKGGLRVSSVGQLDEGCGVSVVMSPCWVVRPPTNTKKIALVTWDLHKIIVH